MNRLNGLDLLRCLALVLITWQHAASVLGYYEQTQWRGISPGQSGVALFCAISGLLAFSSRPQRLGEWMSRRLYRLFPAYWIVTIFAFLLVLMFPGKPITIGLFVSQMFGTGYFTHGWELVNVVSWFISLILLCYFLALMAWRCRAPGIFWWLAIAVCCALLALRLEVILSRHVIAFAFGALIALGANQRLLTVIAALLLVIAIFLDSQFAYAGLAMALLLPSLRDRLTDYRVVKTMSRYSYEYFLVHGICLSAAVKFLEPRGWAIAVAIVCAALASVLLNRTIGFLERRVLPSARQAI